MTRRSRYVVVGGIAAICLAAVAVRGVISQIQLLGQTEANLATSLLQYIADNGHMPPDLASLVRAGCLVPGSDGRLTIDGHSGLYCLDQVAVDWAVDIKQLTVAGNLLVSRLTGEPEYIVRVRASGVLGLIRADSGMRTSIRVYEALRGASTQPSKYLDSTGQDVGSLSR